MTKITVESLAKQLKVSSAEVLKCLESIGVFVPNAKAAMEMDEIRKVCVKLTGKEPRFRRPAGKNPTEPVKKQEPKAEAPKAEAPKAEAPKAEAPKVEAPKAEAPKAEAPKAEAPKAEAPKAEAPKAEAPKAEAPKTEAPKPRENAPVKNENRAGTAAPKAEHDNKERPQSQRYERPQGQRSDRPQGQRYDRSQGQSGDRPQGQRYDRPQGQRSDRPQGQRYDRSQNQSGDRPQGQRYDRSQNQSGDRPQGQRYDRSQNQSGDRPQGQRYDRSQNQSGDRPQGQRYDRSQNQSGDRPQGQRYDRPQGQRSDRPQGQRSDRPQGQRSDRPYNNNRPGGMRPQGARNNRPSDELAIPEAPKEVTTVEKPKKTERMRRDKEKDKERAKNAAQDNFGRKHKNLMPVSEDDVVVKNRAKKAPKPVQKPQEVEEEIKVVQLPPVMTVREFADMVKKPVTQIIKSLMLKGKLMGQNDDLDYEQAEALALDMDILAEPMQEEDIFKEYMEQTDAPESLKSRPPVVVVMGHVDHGKTSLLDAIRKTKVTAGEAGGITQHIGASVVSINGRKITFLDTPGHEAFTAMRMRGAQVTDIAILVVAADDGIMPQTIEAINHAKAAGVQIIVAINKMDKPEANPDHVKQQLTEYELIPEEWGGSTICVPVSAKSGEGIDTLLEMILLVADMEEYKANPDRPATGHVIEAQLDKGRGVVATALVQNGTLHIGDSIVVGKAYGKIKAMNDDTGKKVKTAGPSMAVEILGLSEVPTAGEQFFVTPGEREARQLAEKVSARDREKLIEGTKKVSLESLFDQIQAGSMKELNILVKADVQGSVEAVRQSLEKLSNDQVALRIIHGGVGAINESDVTLAAASNSIIIGFNVRPDAGAKAVAEREKVDMRLYRVIYDAIEDIDAAMKGMLDPEYQEKITGHAEVRQVFKASGIGTIAGSYVTDGKIARGNKVRLVRDGIVIYEGELDSLRRFKDDVKEVAANYECGIMLKSYSDIKEGDIIEAFVMEEIKRS